MAINHSYGSFSYKVINPKVKKVLEARELLNNTLQIGTPFVKATATIEIPEFLGPGNIGFTLGIHNHPTDISYENIYSDRSGQHPLVGYTYTSDGKKNEPVYAKVPDSDVTQMIALFENQTSLYTFPEKQSSRIPPPGITNLSIGRNKNGLISVAEFRFSVPSLIQLEVLHRVFLIPGVGMVIEWGQEFAKDGKNEYGEMGLTDPNIMFPWYNPTKRTELLTRLGKREVGLQEIMDEYVTKSQGQYMWMFGRVANFSTKANSDGSFECSVKVVGPSEDSWAYSTKNTVIPPKDNSGKICFDSVHSVESYFKISSLGLNLKSLLDDVLGNPQHQWNGHVVQITNGNQKPGEPTDETKTPNISEYGFGDDPNAYFMTWRFFVNVVLNDENVGVKAIFKKAGLSTDELSRIAILKPYLFEDIAKKGPIDDPFENFVGSNKYLRSIDPSTLIIINEAAAAAADIERENAQIVIDRKYTGYDESQLPFTIMGDYNKLPDGFNDVYLDKAFLSTGVWLNHKAVVVSMLGADTLIKGISALLDKMNLATSNYWGLSIDETEPSGLGDTHNYTVVDTKLRESSLRAVEVALNDLHTFNKYVRTKNKNLVGSELIDCQVDLSLPKRMFAQIGTLGLVQPNDIELLNPPSGEDVSSTTPIISDPNETLRKMFAITTLSPKQGEKNPDITLQYASQGTSAQRSICGNTLESQLPLLTAGSGVGNTTVSKDAAAKVTKAEASSSLTYAKDQYNRKCQRCPDFTEQQLTQASSTNEQIRNNPIPPEPPPVNTLDQLPATFRAQIEALLQLVPDARVVETIRSPQRSDWLYGFGRFYDDGRGKVSKAKGGQSWHNYGLAVDIINRDTAYDNERWFRNVLGPAAERVGLYWGGNFSDPDLPHVEWKNMPRSPRIIHKDLLAKNDLNGVWRLVGAQG